MKTLDIIKHKTMLTNILLSIYKESALAGALGFKGGTAAMLFYELPRMSVDLDFDLIRPYSENYKELKRVFDKLTNLFSTKNTIKDQCMKYNTLFWAVSYGENFSQIKIEISTRDCSFNQYRSVIFYGVTVKVMTIGDMISHKLIALMSRKSLANRDLFDVHYFLNSKYAPEINYELLSRLIDQTPKEFFIHLLEFISKINPNTILSGLGEILSESQKDWAKAKLVVELKELIQRQIDLL